MKRVAIALGIIALFMLWALLFAWGAGIITPG